MTIPRTEPNEYAQDDGDDDAHPDTLASEEPVDDEPLELAAITVTEVDGEPS